MVASYDHTTDVRTRAVLRWGLDVNDHANPSLHVLPGGRLLVFYNRHGGDRLYSRVSRKPENVGSWGPPRTVPTNTRGEADKGYSYPNPLQLSDENNRLWLFWRGGNWQPTFSTTDFRNGWTTARTLITKPGQRPYVKYESNRRNAIDFAFTQGHPGSTNSNIYYARYRGGALYRANGTKIKSLSRLPLEPREAHKVYDTERKAWVHDIALDSAGRPVIVYAVFESEERHYYEYARWTGAAWKRSPIPPASRSISGSYYSGGITLDHEHPAVVYLSRTVRGQAEVETWRTPDGGTSWTSEKVTSGSSVHNLRPISPRGLRAFGDDLSTIWMRGSYHSYLSYKTDITTLLLNGGNRPPNAVSSISPRAGGSPLRVKLDGTGSRDPDGSIVSWVWSFGDGTQGSGRTPSHTYRSRGRYFVKLTVTDDAGDRDAFVSEVVVR